MTAAGVRRMIRAMHPLALALALPLAAALAACDGTPDDDGVTVPAQPCSAETATPVGDVAVTALQFIPSCARVAPGGQVTFTNLDWDPHWVTAGASAETFDSGYLYPGHRFTHTFVTSGAEIRVHCLLHPEASGRIFVVP